MSDSEFAFHVAVTVAAFVYDAHNEAAAESSHAGAGVAKVATR